MSRTRCCHETDDCVLSTDYYCSYYEELKQTKIKLTEASEYIKIIEEWANNPIVSTNPEGDYATFLARRPRRQGNE